MLVACGSPRCIIELARAAGPEDIAMSIGVTEWLMISAVVILRFGRGKVAALVGEIGCGVRSFRQGLVEPAAEAGRIATVAPARAEPKGT